MKIVLFTLLLSTCVGERIELQCHRKDAIRYTLSCQLPPDCGNATAVHVETDVEGLSWSQVSPHALEVYSPEQLDIDTQVTVDYESVRDQYWDYLHWLHINLTLMLLCSCVLAGLYITLHWNRRGTLKAMFPSLTT